MAKGDKDTIGFDTAHAARIEGDVLRIAGRIETIIGDREQQKKFVADNWEDSNSREGYDTKENAWVTAAGDTLELVRRARKLLAENQVTAQDSSNRVSKIIDAI